MGVTNYLIIAIVFLIILSVIIMFLCRKYYMFDHYKDTRDNPHRKSFMIRVKDDKNEGFLAFNPSIVNLKGNIYCYVRWSYLQHKCPYNINYHVNKLMTTGFYHVSNIVKNVQDLSLMGKIDRKTFDLKSSKILQILPGNNVLTQPRIEDIRLIEHDSKIYGIGNIKYDIVSNRSKRDMCLIKFRDVVDWEIEEQYVIRPDFDLHIERQKNWMPFFIGSDLFFVYNMNPFTIVKLNWETHIASKFPHVDPTSLSIELNGGPPLLKVGNVFLGLVHTVHPYKQLFFTMSTNLPYRILKVSDLFCFDDGDIECPDIQFASGMCFWDKNTVAISFGEFDCDSRITLYSLKKIESMLRSFKTSK